MANNGRNGFVEYETDCDKVWVYKLVRTYEKICSEVFNYTDKILQEPIFEINAVTSNKWGSWNASTRIMSFSASLLRNFEWGAVEHVMRHEVAHQIVSEIFNADCYGVSHGELWGEACKIVGIEAERCSSSEFLSSFKGSESSPMVDKVRKLLIHANDSGATEAEAESFMRKAKELMLRHDIDMKDVTGSERVWVTRPIGPLFKRWASYMWALGRLLSINYNVKYIKTYGPNNTSRLELFGEPDNLDIAEYVGHALLNQAERLYNEHNNDESRERGYGHRLSKRAFIEGLITGYARKLELDKENAIERVGVMVAKEEAERQNRSYVDGDRALIPAYNVKLLNEIHGNCYSGIKTRMVSVSRGAGFLEGKVMGSRLRLSKGVQYNGMNGKLLCA